MFQSEEKEKIVVGVVVGGVDVVDRRQASEMGGAEEGGSLCTEAWIGRGDMGITA